MPLKERDHILIEKYILGQLDSKEEVSFEARMKDTDFEQELNLQKDLSQAFKAEGRVHLKNQLQQFESKISGQSQQEAVVRRLPLRRILLIAAGVACLVLAVYFASNTGPTNQDLFAQNFSPYPNVEAPIDKGSNTTDPRASAFQSYEQGNYPAAIQQLEQLANQNDAVYFYKGICYLAIENSSSAISSFEAMQDKGGQYYIPGQWYKALALIQQGDREQAKPFIEYVTKNAETMALRNQAKLLFEALD